MENSEEVNTQVENIDKIIEKKVSINEDNNTEKIIEEIDEEDTTVEDGNVIDFINLDKNLVGGFVRLIELAVSRGIFVPNEVENVGKVFNEVKEQINDEESVKIKKTSLNNLKILIELTIQRGGFKLEELADVGRLYEILKNLLINNM